MKIVEKSAKTVDEAIDLAVSELGVSKEDVEIEIIEQGSRGLLGLIGAKNAHVKVTYKANYSKIVKEFLSGIFEHMGINCNIEATESKRTVNVKITGEKMGLLIGNRGETLDSLQYLASLLLNKYDYEEHMKVFIDIGDYRKKREETLINLAQKLAHTVRKTGKRIELEPMNAYERRILHCALEGDRFVNTYSFGDEPNRRVVVTLKENDKKNV